MSFPGVTAENKPSAAGVGTSAATGFMAGGPLGALVGVGAGLFGGGGRSGTDVSKAVSGGTFMTGDMGTGKDGSTILIIAAIALGLFFIFKRKK